MSVASDRRPGSSPAGKFRASCSIAGGSSSCRTSAICRSDSALTSVTRKPLLRTDSTKPRFSRSSTASRTGVADTSNCAARVGTVSRVPGANSPVMIAADNACSTWARRFRW